MQIKYIAVDANQLRETLREVNFAALLKEDSCFIFPAASFLDNHNSPGR